MLFEPGLLFIAWPQKHSPFVPIQGLHPVKEKMTLLSSQPCSSRTIPIMSTLQKYSKINS